MSGLLQEVRDTIDGKQRLQAVFGEENGAKLADLAIKLRSENGSSAPDFIRWMLMDAARGSSFDAIWNHWSAKLKAVKR